MLVQWFKKVTVYVMVFSMTSSCGNILEDTANKTTEEAILYQARMHLAEGDWNNAIAQFTRLSPATLADTRVLVDMASAYSGRCGLDFITISLNLQNFNPAATKFFAMVLPIVLTTTATHSDCVTSETILKTIASDGVVVDDSIGKFLMAFSSLAKIAAILNLYADTDDDGLVDAGWDACDPGGLADMPDAEMNEIVTGFFLFINNIVGLAVGDTIGTDLLTQCEMVLGAGQCETVDAASVTAGERLFMRSALVETDDNVGLAVRAGGLAASMVDPMCNL